jgi:hypothetical protein
MFRSAFFRKQEKRPYWVLDPKVAPLVDAMNATGFIQTLASCQGHWQPGNPPYIYFKCSVDVAAALEKSIRKTGMNDGPQLHAHWIVEGCFDASFDLAFRLYAPTYNDDAFSMSSITRFGIRRKEVDEDLLSLLGILRKLAPHFRNDLIPEVRAKS